MFLSDEKKHYLWKKAFTIILINDDHSYLKTQTRFRIIQSQTLNCAKILLLKADSTLIDTIADKVGMNRKRVRLCIINIACQKPINLGYSARNMDT